MLDGGEPATGPSKPIASSERWGLIAGQRTGTANCVALRVGGLRLLAEESRCALLREEGPG